MPISTDVDKVRLLIGDTNVADALFSDEELQWFIDEESSIDAAAAGACESLARKYAQDANFAQDDSKFDLGDRAKHFAALAKELRARASGGLRVSRTQRVDGYSDDVPNRGEPGELGGVGRERDPWYTGHGRGL